MNGSQSCSEWVFSALLQGGGVSFTRLGSSGGACLPRSPRPHTLLSHTPYPPQSSGISLTRLGSSGDGAGYGATVGPSVPTPPWTRLLPGCSCILREEKRRGTWSLATHS